MASFNAGDIVRVPFPYTDRSTRQHRPALVVSNGGLGDPAGLVWVVMITSAENRLWPGDISLGENYASAGLPAPSLIRPAKIATIEAAHADLLGHLPMPLLAKVMTEIRHILAI